MTEVYRTTQRGKRKVLEQKKHGRKAKFGLLQKGGKKENLRLESLMILYL